MLHSATKFCDNFSIREVDCRLQMAETSRDHGIQIWTEQLGRHRFCQMKIIFKVFLFFFCLFVSSQIICSSFNCPILYSLTFSIFDNSISGQLYVPRTRTVTFRPRSFEVCGPTIWNDLPAGMKDPSLSFDSFRKLLKTFLFDKWLLHERICGSCINLRGEMFIIIIIIIIIFKVVSAHHSSSQGPPLAPYHSTDRV